MLGQLILSPGGRGKAAPGRLYGLSVLRAEVDRSGFWGERRLRRAGKGLRLGGALRVLVPGDFPLALAALERQGLSPDRATVALRGRRAGREMARAAALLSPKVRRLVVDAPQGGQELAEWLRMEFGIPILPPDQPGQAALRFQPDCPRLEEASLDLYGPRPQLAGLKLSAPELAEEDQEDLALLAALWEGGRLAPEAIKIT